MCFSLLDSAIAGCGLATRVRFCSVSALAQVLRAAVPYGKIVLIAEEGESFALAGRLREGLGEFRPVSVVLGGEDKLEGLFSLADDVRAAVGIGERGALAARFFATLRGGYSCAVPLAPHAGGIFEPTAPGRLGLGRVSAQSRRFCRCGRGENAPPLCRGGRAAVARGCVCGGFGGRRGVFGGGRRSSTCVPPRSWRSMRSIPQRGRKSCSVPRLFSILQCAARPRSPARRRRAFCKSGRFVPCPIVCWRFAANFRGGICDCSAMELRALSLSRIMCGGQSCVRRGRAYRRKIC